jgi:hypothetical protein
MKHFTVTRITIIQQQGNSDLVLLHTNLPPGIVRNREPLALEFRTAEGTGPQYCKTALGIEDYPGSPCSVEIVLRS